MMLKQEKYQAFSAIQMSFRVSPMCAAFYVLLSLAYALVGTLGIALTTAHFVDTAVDILQNARPRGDVVFPLILLLVVLGVDTTARAVVQLFAARIELNLQRKFKPAIVEKHAALDFKHIENAGSWELIARISRDPVKAVMDGFDGFVTLMRIIISVVSVGLLIMTHIWWAAVVIFVFSIPMFWLSVWAGKKNYQATRDTEQYYRRVDYLDEVLTGRDAVDERTLFGYGETVGEQWLEQYEIRRKKLLRIHARMYYINKGSGVFLGLIVVFVAMTLIQPVIAGTVTAGLFMGIIGAVFSLLNGIGWMMTGALEQISSVGEYMKDLTAFAHLSEASGALNKPDKSPLDLETLEFRNVRFRYPGSDKTILDGLTFSLERGRHYAFVGRNGAGKTTLTKLLTGLYTEYEGEILINGKELREYEQSALKALFSVVYQDFARYYISMKDNVLLGDVSGEQDDTRVMDAIQQAGLADTVTGLKDGADSPLGKIKEGGQDLSGGQWQRVAIARSLMSRASVKILDEPTAALDPISESRIYEEFEHLMSGKTTIFISHRLGSTKLADDIIVIDGGQVAERGVHDQLMAKGGIYAEMYESQRRWYV